MSKHFQLLDFLRRTPKDLLKLYALRRGVLQGFAWGAGQRVDEARVAAALKAEGDEAYRRTVTEFRKIWNLKGREFTQGILNEVRFHRDRAALETLTAQHSHLGKAIWAILERPDVIRNAKILRDIDRLPDGAWLKYAQLPLRPGEVTSSTEQALQTALVEFFVRTQFRGANCKVDSLQREEESIFYAYSEDHPDTDLSFLDGILTPQIVVPVFQVIFKHNNCKRTLDLYLDGDRTIGPKLRVLFCRVALGEEVEELPDEHAAVYEPQRLLERGFKFKFSKDLGIAEVHVSKLRIVVQGQPWCRIMAEADVQEDRQALLELVDRLMGVLPRGRVFVDQACINVRFEKGDDQPKAPYRTVWITHPRSLRLKRDELGDRIIEMLAQSDIERSAPDPEP